MSKINDNGITREMTAEEQAQVDNIVQVEKDNIAEMESKPKSRAFAMARALNPEPTIEEMPGVEKMPPPDPMESWEAPAVSDEQMVEANKLADELDEFEDKVESSKKSFKEWEEENSDAMAEGTTTESFLDEVEKVEKESSAPVISKAQVNEEQAENIVADEVDVVEEEEYEEIVIPSESELKRMKKNQINELAKDFEFVVKMTDTKAKMIEDFLSQVDEYITELQESGEFVSANVEDEDGDTDDRKDGGLF